MIDPHPRSFLHAACWLYENDEWDCSFFLPRGVGTAPEDVSSIHPDGVSLLGPAARVERYRRIAEYYALKIMADEEKKFREASGVTGELDDRQQAYVKENTARGQRELAYLALRSSTTPKQRFDDRGQWLPTRETITSIVVGCHAYIGKNASNRNTTADMLNEGIPRAEAVSGVTGDFVRNALITYEADNFRWLGFPNEHPASLMCGLNRLADCCRLYGHLWGIYAKTAPYDPLAALMRAYDTGELDEDIIQFDTVSSRIGSAVGPAVQVEILNIATKRLGRRLASLSAA